MAVAYFVESTPEGILVKHLDENKYSFYSYAAGNAGSYAKKSLTQISISSLLVYESNDCSGQPYVDVPPSYQLQAIAKFDKVIFSIHADSPSYGNSKAMELEAHIQQNKHLSYASSAKCATGDTCASVDDFTCIVGSGSNFIPYTPVTVTPRSSFQYEHGLSWYIAP
jgi:hypothetical protein